MSHAAPNRIALLNPGEMGAAVGAVLKARGFDVVWASAGRSAATRQRAQQAGLRDAGSTADALRDADIALSIVPPHAALDLAREVAALGFKGTYVDANAISPETAREVARIVEAAGAHFVDGGIIGGPPQQGSVTRLYLAGESAQVLAAVFNTDSLQVRALDGAVGAASALKVAYAAWSKGSIALLAAIRGFAQAEGIESALLAEWQRSQPGIAERSAAVAGSARKAWRWVAEMEEIAASLVAHGLPAGFHAGAADIYARLGEFKDIASAPDIVTVLDAITGHTGE
jgi:3-hydroxyisobutyrate dehydrogenase-like beta-hydroxyacid dehydrogenase